MYLHLANAWSRRWREAIRGQHPGAFFSLLRLICWFVSLPYAWSINLRRWLYRNGFLRIHRLPARVISVGNITTGGTGKTPVVALLVKHLAGRGIPVAVLTRGYGRKTSGIRILFGGQRSWEEVGDEPLMLSRMFPDIPVVVCRDRVKAGKLAIERFGSRVLILDDGMQHMRLDRDLEVVVIDSTCPFDNERIFPAGTLREGLGGLRRANLFFLTRANHCPEIDQLAGRLYDLNPKALQMRGAFRAKSIRELHTGRQSSPETLQGQRILAFAGIGNPASLRRSLEECGAHLVDCLPFPDHYPYRAQDVNFIQNRALRLMAERIVTTEKDAVRIPLMNEPRIPFIALSIEIEVLSGWEKLWQVVEGGM
jgi:tetraacyldisaccharide 4'-kinase